MKVDELVSKINEIKKMRMDSNASKNYGRVKKDKDTKQQKKKKGYHHSKLEYVLADIALSPYLTRPDDKYPASTVKKYADLMEFKSKGISYKDIPKEKIPVDIEDAKAIFVHEVINYSVAQENEERMRKMMPSSIGGPLTSGKSTSSSVRVRTGVKLKALNEPVLCLYTKLVGCTIKNIFYMFISIGVFSFYNIKQIATVTLHF